MNHITYAEYKFWYTWNDIKFKIIGYTRNREVAFLDKLDYSRGMRFIRIHNIQGLDFWLQLITFNNTQPRLCSVYSSIAFYDEPVPFRRSNSKDDLDMGWWNEQHEHIEGIDLIIDVDSPKNLDLEVHTMDDIKDMVLWTAVHVKAKLESFGLPFHIRFSGRGFHFIVPHKYLPQNLSFDKEQEHNYFTFFRAWVKRYFYHGISELVDWNIIDTRRLHKIPYTLAIYPQYKGDLEPKCTVCFPFVSEKEFKDFSWEMVEMSYWLKQNIRKRTDYLFNASSEKVIDWEDFMK